MLKNFPDPFGNKRKVAGRGWLLPREFLPEVSKQQASGFTVSLTFQGLKFPIFSAAIIREVKTP
jgi:hypothetical protein